MLIILNCIHIQSFKIIPLLVFLSINASDTLLKKSLAIIIHDLFFFKNCQNNVLANIYQQRDKDTSNAKKNNH